MEKEILERLRNGDERAVKYIFDKYYNLLCHFANQILNDSSLSEEITDDVIFYLWEHRADIEITHTIRAYLLRAVRNRCLNEINSLSHRTEYSMSTYISDDNVEFLDTLFADTNHPLGILIGQELEEKLKEYIDALPEECRKVFKKSRFEQKKYEEIAYEFGISVNTVKYHMKNALSYLNANLSEYLKVLLVYIFMEK